MEFLRASLPSSQCLFADASYEHCELVLRLGASKMGSLSARETRHCFGGNFRFHCVDTGTIYKYFKSEEVQFRPNLRRNEVPQKIAFWRQIELHRGYLNYDWTVP